MYLQVVTVRGRCAVRRDCSCRCAPLGGAVVCGVRGSPEVLVGLVAICSPHSATGGALRSVGSIGRLTAMADVGLGGAPRYAALKRGSRCNGGCPPPGGAALCRTQRGSRCNGGCWPPGGAALDRVCSFVGLGAFWGGGLWGSVCLTGFLASLPTSPPSPTPRTPPPTAPHFAPRAVIVSIGGHGLGKRTAPLLHAPQNPPTAGPPPK